MALRLIDIHSKGRYSERYINHYEVFTEAFVYLNLLVKTCQSNWEHEDFYSFTKHYCAQNEKSLLAKSQSYEERIFILAWPQSPTLRRDNDPVNCGAERAYLKGFRVDLRVGQEYEIALVVIENYACGEVEVNRLDLACLVRVLDEEKGDARVCYHDPEEFARMHLDLLEGQKLCLWLSGSIRTLSDIGFSILMEAGNE